MSSSSVRVVQLLPRLTAAASHCCPISLLPRLTADLTGVIICVLSYEGGREVFHSWWVARTDWDKVGSIGKYFQLLLHKLPGADSTDSISGAEFWCALPRTSLLPHYLCLVISASLSLPRYLCLAISASLSLPHYLCLVISVSTGTTRDTAPMLKRAPLLRSV